MCQLRAYARPSRNGWAGIVSVFTESGKYLYCVHAQVERLTKEDARRDAEGVRADLLRQAAEGTLPS
jgi:hypothetical protein